MMDRVFLAEATGYHGIPGVDTMGVGMLAPMLIAEASEDIWNWKPEARHWRICCL